MGEQKKGKYINIGKSVTLILLLCNILISFGIIIFLAIDNDNGFGKNEMGTYEKYAMYIGLNDKDTNRQEISQKEAESIVNAICAEYADGYTAFEAIGHWTDENDTVINENTLVYVFYDIEEDVLQSMANEITEKLNQKSVLIEKQKTEYTYLTRAEK